MPDDSLLTQLDLLDQYVRDLQGAQPPNFDAYQRDKMLRRYLERMLHMAVDAAIRIGIGVLTHGGYRSPENYRDVFIVLGEHGTLPREMVQCMIALVEFRNLLVYEPAAVDDTIVYGFAKKRLNDLAEFSGTVRDYINPRASSP